MQKITSGDMIDLQGQKHMVWQAILKEAREASRDQPLMASFFHSNVINHQSFADSIAFYLSSRLASDAIPAMTIRTVFEQAIQNKPDIVDCMLDDLLAHYTRDAACDQYIIPLLYFKGFHALQCYRIAHWLWSQQRDMLAIYLQHRISELFAVDIHPAAQIGSGIMLDHATGLVIGETAVIGNDVSILHGVTLGGSGASGGNRHPKIGSGVLLSAGAKLLGNITVGDGAKIGAGSLVLTDVPARVTVAGVPAKQVGRARVDKPSLAMDHSIDQDE
ncbi:MAG: serine O-acetyltransferase [Pseudomonadota bacterium]